MNYRKKRFSVFTSAEKELLITLIEKYAAIIENKKSDANIWKEKEKTWKKILEEFEAISDVKRSVQNLKIKYESLRTKAKQELKNNLHIATKISPISQRIISLMEYSTMVLYNSFDGDALSKDVVKAPAVTSWLDSVSSNNDNSTKSLLNSELEINDDEIVIEDHLCQRNENEIIDSNLINFKTKSARSALNPEFIPRSKLRNKIRNKKKKLKSRNDMILKKTINLILAQQNYLKNEESREEEKYRLEKEKHQWKQEKHHSENIERQKKLQLLDLEIKIKKKQLEDLESKLKSDC